MISAHTIANLDWPRGVNSMARPISKRILHICNWYPNNLDEIEGQFIKGQIDALDRFIPGDVLLLQIRHGAFKFRHYSVSSRERIWILQVPVRSWFLREIASSVALWFFLIFRYDPTRYSMINFHVAYPLLTYFHLFRKRIKVPVVITEHWSAYHFNFGTSKELKRIKRIFRFFDPVITVSKSLASDIHNFAGMTFTTYQLPNVVNDGIFRLVNAEPTQQVRFFMLGCWQFPKVPWVVLDALAQLKSDGYKFILRIGGYGPYEDDLRDRIVSLNLMNEAEFIGKLSAEESAREMQSASFFLHPSNYETFSLVCAEALSCGVPVIASAVGGITEYLNGKNGILISGNNCKNWTEALKASFTASFDRMAIARDAKGRFSRERVGKQYETIVQKIIGKSI